MAIPKVPNGHPNGQPHLTWVNVIVTLGLLTTVAAGGWALFQQQFSGLEAQIHAANADLYGQIKENRAELERLRAQAILRTEHTEFVKRLDDEASGLKKRLDVLEATRPTTGELQAVAQGVQGQINEVKERLRFLEQSHPYPVPQH